MWPMRPKFKPCKPSTGRADCTSRNNLCGAGIKGTHPEDPASPQQVHSYVRYGASPRGMQAMILAGKIIALMDGRYNVAFDDIRQAAVPALRHRLILSFEAQADGIHSEQVIQNILEAVVPEEAR